MSLESELKKLNENISTLVEVIRGQTTAAAPAAGLSFDEYKRAMGERLTARGADANSDEAKWVMGQYQTLGVANAATLTDEQRAQMISDFDSQFGA